MRTVIDNSKTICGRIINAFCIYIPEWRNASIDLLSEIRSDLERALTNIEDVITPLLPKLNLPSSSATAATTTTNVCADSPFQFETNLVFSLIRRIPLSVNPFKNSIELCSIQPISYPKRQAFEVFSPGFSSKYSNAV